MPGRQGPGMGFLRSWERKERQRVYASPLLVIQSFSHPLIHLFIHSVHSFPKQFIGYNCEQGTTLGTE